MILYVEKPHIDCRLGREGGREGWMGGGREGGREGGRGGGQVYFTKLEAENVVYPGCRSPSLLLFTFFSR